MKKIGFKGFDKKLQCRRFQFEVGKTCEHKGELQLCNSGFHFCEHPFDVFSYYAPADSRFAEVEVEEVLDKSDGDTKRVAKKLTIRTEITLQAMLEAAVKFVFDHADWSKQEQQATSYQGAASATGDQGVASATGDQGVASATGDQGAASATGYRGAASATGDQGAASATGDQGAASATGDQGAASATGVEGCAVSLGLHGKAKGVKGSWLTLAKWQKYDGNWHRVSVKTVKIDDRRIKPDIYYQLSGGKFVENKQ